MYIQRRVEVGAAGTCPRLQYENYIVGGHPIKGLMLKNNYEGFLIKELVPGIYSNQDVDPEYPQASTLNCVQKFKVQKIGLSSLYSSHVHRCSGFL